MQVLGPDLAAVGTPFVYLGHALEAIWFVIDDCARTGDTDTLIEAMLLFQRHYDRSSHTSTRIFVQPITSRTISRTASSTAPLHHQLRYPLSTTVSPTASTTVAIVLIHCKGLYNIDSTVRAWDQEFGGLLSTLLDAPHKPVGDDKIGWVQTEGIAGLALVIQHSAALGAALGHTTLLAWALQRYLELEAYCQDKFQISCGHRHLALARDGNSVSQKGGFGGVQSLEGRRDNYHHPRCVLIALQALRAFNETLNSP